METKIEPFKKVLRIGAVKVYTGRHRAGCPPDHVAADVFVKVEYSEDGRLSLSGVEGPRSNGDAWGSCGQLDMHLKPGDVSPAPGWSRHAVARLLSLWGRWHLNDMRAGCAHQRAMGWDKWLNTPKDPVGRPCPTCGYKYGSAWLREEVPAEVLEELRGFPDADKSPAWV